MLECMTPKICTSVLVTAPRKKSLTGLSSAASPQREASIPNVVFRSTSEPTAIATSSSVVPVPIKANLITFHWVGGDKHAYRPFIKDWEKEGICVWSFVLPSRTIPHEQKYQVSDLANMFLDALKVQITTQTQPPSSASLLKEKENPIKPVPMFMVDVPLVLLGHSLGGVLAYEVARRWSVSMAGFAVNLKHLIISSVPTPANLTQLNIRDEGKGYSMLAESDLLDHVRALGGVPDGVDPSFVLAKIQIIRSDFSIYQSYNMHNRVTFQPTECRLSGKEKNARPQSQIFHEQVTCNISVFASAGDAMVTTRHMLGWNEFTSGTHESYLFQGTHFYLLEREDGKAQFTQKVVSIVLGVAGAHEEARAAALLSETFGRVVCMTSVTGVSEKTAGVEISTLVKKEE